VLVRCRCKGYASIALSLEVDQVLRHGLRGHVVLAVYRLASNLKQDSDKSIEHPISQLIIVSYLLDDLKCGCSILTQKHQFFIDSKLLEYM